MNNCYIQARADMPLWSMTKNQFDFNIRVEYHEARKRAFHQHARKQLQALALALGLPPGLVRNNSGGIAVSGEVTLHSENLYVQVSQSCCRLPGILIRTCKGLKDYWGGTNHFADANLLNDIPALVKTVRRVTVPIPLFSVAENCSRNAEIADTMFGSTARD